MTLDFDPEKAFQALDQDRDGFITAYEIYRFLRDTSHTAVPLSEADSVIREFDGNLDNKLSFSEFAQFALPATSYSLRDIALKRPNAALYSYSYKYQPLSYTTLRQLAELLEQEMRFQRTRSDLRRELIRHDDFVKSRYFDLLSLGKHCITVDDLIYFLNKNGQRTVTEDLEAILRRCDHTGD